MKKIKLSTLAKDMYCRFRDDDIPALSAQLTYYFILSFFPFLIFLLTLASLTPIGSNELIEGLSKFLPESFMPLISQVIKQAQASHKMSFISLSMVVTFWGASNGTSAVRSAINKAYDQEEKRPFWKLTGLSLIFTAVLAIVLLAAFSLFVSGRYTGSKLFGILGADAHYRIWWYIIKFLLSPLTMLFVFLAIYIYIPNRRLKFTETLPGAIFACAGWMLLSYGFSIYIRFFGSMSSLYGNIGSIILFLIWLNWCGTVLVLGGELNASLYFFKNEIKKPERKKFC